MLAKRTLTFILCVLMSSAYASIHGTKDDRIYSDQHHDQRLKELSYSVAAMIPVLPDNEELPLSTLIDKKGMCSDQPFAQAPILPTCTGVLVGKDKILTAGHCIRTQEECERFAWTFNFRQEKMGSTFDLKEAESYHCKKLVASEKNYLTHLDYAIIQLDRPVLDRAPVPRRLRGEIAKDTPLAIIGHPTGLPSIIAGGGKVLDPQVSAVTFTTDLDAFGGNSGSPVFNLQTYELEGILIRGGTDFDTNWESEDLCRKWYRCSENPGMKCETEDVCKITSIPTP